MHVCVCVCAYKYSRKSTGNEIEHTYIPHIKPTLKLNDHYLKTEFLFSAEASFCKLQSRRREDEVPKCLLGNKQSKKLKETKHLVRIGVYGNETMN
jgi:hypothetical protein